MSVDADNPGRGDVAGVLAAARERSMKATAMRDAERELQAAIAGVTPDVWAGEAAMAFVAAAASSATEVAGLAARWDAEATALSAYARGVQDIQDRQRTLELQRDEASADLRAAERSQRNAAAEEAVAVTFGGVADTKQSERYGRSVARHRQTLTDIEASWQTLIDDRDAVNRACITALTDEGVLGRLAPGTLGGLQSGDAMLTGLTATDLLVLARTNPGLLEKLKASDPATVQTWWGGLGADDQTALIAAMPGLIGNLEGVRYTDRDRANRVWLRQQIAEAKRDIATQNYGASDTNYGAAGGYQQETAVAAALARLRGLEAIQKTLHQGDSDTPRLLISLTDDRPPLAAVALGDLDSAQNVTFAVPGMGSSAESMPDWAASSEKVLRAQRQVDDARSHAVVAWIGYEAPPVGGTQVLGTGLARAGGANLADALCGFAATRPGADLNVLAHSYGTTTTAIALTDAGVHVDSFVSIGSAGLPPDIDEASDLHADHVFAGQAQDVWAVDPAPGDQWAWFGRAFGDHPVNPVGSDFGAQTFGVDSGIGGTAVGDHGVSAPGDTGYLDANTESLWNVAYATTRHADLLTAAPRHEPTPFQQAIIGASGVN